MHTGCIMNDVVSSGRKQRKLQHSIFISIACRRAILVHCTKSTIAYCLKSEYQVKNEGRSSQGEATFL